MALDVQKYSRKDVDRFIAEAIELYKQSNIGHTEELVLEEDDRFNIEQETVIDFGAQEDPFGNLDNSENPFGEGEDPFAGSEMEMDEYSFEQSEDPFSGSEDSFNGDDAFGIEDPFSSITGASSDELFDSLAQTPDEDVFANSKFPDLDEEPLSPKKDLEENEKPKSTKKKRKKKKRKEPIREEVMSDLSYFD